MSAELCKSRNKLADVNDQLEVSKQENRKLSLHCEDMSGQLSESERRLKQIEQDKRRYLNDITVEHLILNIEIVSKIK